jgi:hypothetical protein
MYKFLGFVCLLIAAVAQAGTFDLPQHSSEWLPQRPEAQAFPRPTRSVVVNCSFGQKVQAAVDANAGPVEIIVSGICVENVLIRDKDIMLRGAGKPALSGIRSTDTATPALTIRGGGIDSVDSLSFSNSAGLGMSIQGASVTLTNCLYENNGASGLQVKAGAVVLATGLTFNNNVGASINVNNGQIFCTACDVSGNNFAVQAIRGSIVSLLDTMVTGRRGILAADSGTIADVDCVNGGTTHPCGVQVTGVAALAGGGGLASLFGVGDFTGRIGAVDAGTVSLFGSRQIAGAQPGQGSPTNNAEFFGRIEVGTNFDVNPPTQSRLLSTDVTHFGRVLITDDTVLNGTIQCSSAGDAWLDPTIIALPGSAVTGCDHSKLP